MKKSIIISGPAGSGKSHIAEAILSTHKTGDTLVCSFPDLLHDFSKADANLLKAAFQELDVVIVDECSDLKGIKILQSLMHSKLKGSMSSSFVFLTQEKIEVDPAEVKRFHIINLYK